MSNKTVFKMIIDKELPAEVVYEDNEILGIKDAFPLTPVHILVIPKKEISSLDAATEEDLVLLGKIQLVLAKLAREFGIDKTGYRVVTNMGFDGGQTVNHLHYHLMGGRKLSLDV